MSAILMVLLVIGIMGTILSYMFFYAKFLLGEMEGWGKTIFWLSFIPCGYAIIRIIKLWPDYTGDAKERYRQLNGGKNGN